MTDKKIVVGSVTLSRGRIRHELGAMLEAQDQSEALVTEEYLRNAPFQQISLVMNYGDRTDLTPRPLRKDTRWISVTIDLQLDLLKALQPDDLRQVFRFAIAEVLIRLGSQYGLPVSHVISEQDQIAHLSDGTAISRYLGLETGVSEGSEVTQAAGASPGSDLLNLIIQYPLDGWGIPADIEKRHAVEAVADYCLKSTGNGYCDGGDFGSGTMNVFCKVVDSQAAGSAVKDALKEYGVLTDAIIAVDAAETVVLYPPGGKLYGEPA
jgi:hypothetical protein